MFHKKGNDRYYSRVKLPSILDSITSIFSIFPQKIEWDDSITDEEALAQDWKMVGEDFRKTMGIFESETQTYKKNE